MTNNLDEEAALKLLRFGNPRFGPLPEAEPLRRAMALLDEMRLRGHCWLINMDDVGFHLRRVVSVMHNVVADEKKYTVDKPLGTANKLEDLPLVICRAIVMELKSKKKALANERRRRKAARP